MVNKIIGAIGLVSVLTSFGLVLYGVITEIPINNNFFTHGMLILIYSEVGKK